MFGFGQEIILLKRTKTGTDTLGNDVFDLEPVGDPVAGAFAPGGSTEQQQGQDVVDDRPRVMLSPGVVELQPIDAVQVDGLVYEVDGQPNHWRHPITGRDFGWDIPLRRVTG